MIHLAKKIIIIIFIIGFCTTKSLVMNTKKDILNVKGITDQKLKNLIDALKKFDVN